MSFNYCYLILLINIISLSYSKLIIPFKVQNYEHPKGKLNYFYKNIKINLSVGTPPQQITLSACLGEYNTFIIGKYCKNFEGIYNENISDTYKFIKNETFVFEMYDEGNMVKDVFKLGNKEIDDYQFINALNIQYDHCYDIYCEVLTEPGILGLLLQPHAKAEYDFFEYNLINQLKRKDLISNYNFYFDFESNTSGNIIIGSLPNETDQTKFEGKELSTIKVSKVDFSLDWAFKFDDIYYGEERLDREIKKECLLRIEFGLIKLTFEMEKYVKEDFFDKLINQTKCTRKNTEELGTTIHYYYCDKDIDLNNFKPWHFTVNNFGLNFTFTKEDLFLDIGDKYIFLIAFGGSPKIFLGYPFLKKYQLIFNQDDKTIGYFTNIIKEDDKIPIGYIILIAILSVILVGLGIFAFVYFYAYKKKKKYAKELSEETDKTNNNEGLIPNEDNN